MKKMTETSMRQANGGFKYTVYTWDGSRMIVAYSCRGDHGRREAITIYNQLLDCGSYAWKNF